MGFLQENKKHPKRGGWYYFTVDGKNVKYPSITNILGVLDKSRFLVPWASKACSAIACEEPWLTPDEIYNKHRARDVIAAGTRGKGVHNIAEKILENRNYRADGNLEEIYGKYLNPFRNFINDYKPKVIETEKVVRSDKYGIGGSLDQLLEIGGKLWLVDIKTSKAIYNTFHLQLGFYNQALKEEGIETEKQMILHLPGNGKYNLIEAEGNMDIVQALKQVYLWMEK